ncbi:MAG TPA: universal stress protein [Saprospiraceae bacterium]|nr:universal stress protein [Saprospiraceae bacterium]
MNKILIPTDLSPLTDFAYALANKVASRMHADIEILSIVPAPAKALFDNEGNLKEDEGEDFSQWHKEKEELERKIRDWASDKKDITAIYVKIGRVDEDIVRYTKERDIDMIVMGTSGADGMEELLRGSHAQHIIRKASVPVLTLKCDRSDLILRDMLLVSDFKADEPLNLDIIKDLQSVFGTRINLLKVNTPRDFETNREVMQRMMHFATVNDLHNVQYHVYCDQSVEKGIANFSSDSGIDFVCIGTHQRSDISRLFNHSISEELVNHIFQPVLTFPV